MTDFARHWSKALAEAAYVPLPSAEREHLLASLARRLDEAATSADPDPAEPQRVGAELVTAGFRTPEALGRTVTLVLSRFAASDELANARVAGLVEGLATGFARALRSHTLDEQDEVRLAVTRAQLRAELALDAKEAEFRHLATHDPVTGLPNRMAFTEQLVEHLASAHGQHLMVCCLDVNRLNAVNDTLGFPAGDRLLRSIAYRLRAATVPMGWLTARLEGDQFAVLMKPAGTWQDDIERIFGAFATPFHLDGVELPISACGGVTTAGGGVTTAGGAHPGDHRAVAHDLIQQAQIALHWAKADGHARWQVYQPERAAAAADRYRLSADIPKGLRRGEFGLHYQPLVDLATGQVAGAEALARWHHPEHGLLSADRFIPLVEHSGLIVPLGNDLLAQACRQASSWQRPDGWQPYVSVNISGAQLRQPDFGGVVARLLHQCGLPPQRLQVEVTEEAVVETAQATATLDALVRLGVRIAIDDFGTGHSNLLRLSELPFHCLKLDAAFIRTGRPGPAATNRDIPAGFLAATVSLGHTLGLDVTAEGLETAEHVALARAAGCDTGQGWHFGRPRPGHQIPSLATASAQPPEPVSPTPRRLSPRSTPASPPARPG